MKNKHISFKKYTNWGSWGISQQENLCFVWHNCAFYHSKTFTFLKIYTNWKVMFSCRGIPQLSQFVYFLRKMCLFFNFRIMKLTVMHITVHFIIQKLKNKHIFLKKYTNWESWGISQFDKTRGEKNQKFPTIDRRTNPNKIR